MRDIVVKDEVGKAKIRFGRMATGDLYFWRDNFEYRVAGGDLMPFDPSNPPSIDKGAEFALLPRWKCGTTGTVNYSFKATITKPDGTSFEPGDEPGSGYYLDPTNRSVSCSAVGDPAGGIGFYFIADQAGDWSVDLLLYQ